MNKTYVLPEMEIIACLQENVILTSGGNVDNKLIPGGSGPGSSESFNDAFGN